MKKKKFFKNFNKKETLVKIKKKSIKNNKIKMI